MWDSATAWGKLREFERFLTMVSRARALVRSKRSRNRRFRPVSSDFVAFRATLIRPWKGGIGVTSYARANSS